MKKIKKEELIHAELNHGLKKNCLINLYYDKRKRAGAFQKMMEYGKTVDEAYSNLEYASMKLRDDIYMILVYFDEREQRYALYEVPACQEFFKNKKHCRFFIEKHCLFLNPSILTMLKYMPLFQSIKEYYKDSFEEIYNYFS